MSTNLATATKQPEPLSQETKRIRLAEAAGPKLFVIVKPRHHPFCYYRKDACGYTDRIEDAWKVTEDAGREYTMYADAAPTSEAYCDRVVLQPAPLPDYFGSLDTIVAFVRSLLFSKRNAVLRQLREVRKLPSGEYVHDAELALSTPEQWSEACGLALGLWQPGQ